MTAHLPRRRRVVVVPVDLGGSSHRCGLRPARRPPPDPDLVEALIGHYTRERRPTQDTPIEVAFFHGGIPTDDLLKAASPHPVRLSCLPGDLTPAIAQHLLERRVHTLELDIASPHTPIRRGIGRRLGGHHLDRQLRGLRDLGFRLGLVLAPGLPGGSHASAIEAARWAAHRCDFVRIHPALAWEGSASEDWIESGRWTPMDLGQAVTTVAEMMDVFDQADVPVARVGLQPGPDLTGCVVAGPVHPNLRSLVEVRRFRRRMRTALALAPRTRVSALNVHPSDLSWARGTANENVRALRAELRLPGIRVVPDDRVPRGEVHLSASEADNADSERSSPHTGVDDNR